MRVASKYKIKKSIDSTNFDFDLNDPCSKKDFRPFKLSSSLKLDKCFESELKKISRYFKTFQKIQINAEIVQET